MAFVTVSLAAFIVGFVGSLPLAGPIALLVVSSAAERRYGEARRVALGAAVAEGGYAFLAFWGFATFLARHPLALPVSHGVTALILCGLGLHFASFTMKRSGEPQAESKPGRFWLGFSISAANPTLLVTWGAVTTFLYSKALVRFSGPLAIPFGVFAAAGVATWGVATVALLRHFQLPRPSLTWIVRVMGVVMIGMGIGSAVELGRYVLHGAPSAPRGDASAQSACPDEAASRARAQEVARGEFERLRAQARRLRGRRGPAPWSVARRPCAPGAVWCDGAAGSVARAVATPAGSSSSRPSPASVPCRLHRS